jgi:hypothetical protein
MGFCLRQVFVCLSWGSATQVRGLTPPPFFAFRAGGGAPRWGDARSQGAPVERLHKPLVRGPASGRAQEGRRSPERGQRTS